MQLSKKALAIAPSLTLKISAMSAEMKKNGIDVIGFGAGEPDFDTPQYIKDAAIEALAKGMTKYTAASGSNELKSAVCERYQRKYGLAYEPANVVISNGAKHSLFNACQAILNPGDEVIIIAPYWVTYPELVKMADGVPVIVEAVEREAKEEDDFQPNIDRIRRAITPKTKAIIINSPSNPCGCVYERERLEKLAALAQEYDLYIISDEIYDELVYDNYKAYSIASFGEDAKERTIVVNGVSKAYSMTGWRIGYTLSNEKIAKVMGSYQSHATSNPCSIAQYASVAALSGPQDEVKKMLKAFERRRILMASAINAIDGLSCLVPEGAFYIMMNIRQLIGKKSNGREIKGSLDFCEYILEQNKVALIPGIAFGADHHVRLSYATSEENIVEGIKRIGEFVSTLTD